MHLDIDIVNSIGTSLLPVSIFRLTTDVRYSLSGQIGLLVVFLFICGGYYEWKSCRALFSEYSNPINKNIFNIANYGAIYITINTIVW